ncbi:hypothetical protein ACF3DV_24885 [Chlorogloeopsis fritschii PCC 9212]|nr:hypothetical protein [Chlorogloeopsis fritschii]
MDNTRPEDVRSLNCKPCLQVNKTRSLIYRWARSISLSLTRKLNP